MPDSSALILAGTSVRSRCLQIVGSVEVLDQYTSYRISMRVDRRVSYLDLEEKHILADKLVSEIAGSQEVIIPGAAHMLNMERPEAFNQSVQEFLPVR